VKGKLKIFNCKFSIFNWLLLCALQVSAANLVPNPSFEVGIGRGWVNWGDASIIGNQNAMIGFLTNDAVHGRYSFRMHQEARVLRSRMMFLTNSDAVTVSFYAKAHPSAAGPLYADLFAAPELISTPAFGAMVNLGTMTTSWVRYSFTLTNITNGYYQVALAWAQNMGVQLDAFQVEYGTNATTFVPHRTVELGLDAVNTNNVWFAGDAAQVRMNFWNHGAASSQLVLYEVRDFINSNILSSGSTTVSLLAETNTSATVNLPTRYGHFNVRARLANFDDAGDEMTMAVYPFPSNLTVRTDGWLGCHPHASEYQIYLAVLLGYDVVRLLSPNTFATRASVVNPSAGVWNYTDYAFTNYHRYSLKIYAPLTEGDGLWPAHWLSFTNYEEYCSNVVTRFKHTNIVWTLWNEPLQSGPQTPFNLRQETNYAQLCEFGIRGITNADPNAVILFGGGSSGDGAWVYRAFTNMGAAYRARISGFETHQYMRDNITDPNAVFERDTESSATLPWITLFTNVHDTELGTWGVDPVRGWNGLVPYEPGTYGITLSGYDPEASRGEKWQRHPSSLVRLLTQVLSDKGHGADVVIPYDHRYFNPQYYTETIPSSFDYLGVEKPQNVAVSVAGFMVQKGFGRVQNYPNAGLEMYIYTNSVGQALVCAWSNDKTNRSAIITNSVIVVDCMGNTNSLGTTNLIVTRFPTYFISSTLTVPKLTNMFGYATVAGIADTLAPNISIDIAPSGPWQGTNFNLLKWTGIDEHWTQWTTAATATNVLYNLIVNGVRVASGTQSNHWWLTGLNLGNNTVIVEAYDRDYNTNQVSFQFAPGVLPTTVLQGNMTLQGNITIQ
jgi:hypothetical protein